MLNKKILNKASSKNKIICKTINDSIILEEIEMTKNLIDQGHNINEKCEITLEKDDKIKKIIFKNKDIKIYPILLVVYLNNVDYLEKIIDLGVDINIVPNIIEIVIYYDCNKIFDYLIKNKYINVVTLITIIENFNIYEFKIIKYLCNNSLMNLDLARRLRLKISDMIQSKYEFIHELCIYELDNFNLEVYNLVNEEKDKYIEKYYNVIKLYEDNLEFISDYIFKYNKA